MRILESLPKSRTAFNPSRILLLGGTSEIGLAIVEAYLARASNPKDVEVVLAARSSSPHLEVATAKLTKTGAKVSLLPFEATDYDAHPELISRVFESPVDLAIIAFGVLGDRTSDFANQQAAIEVFSVNTTATISVGVLVGQAMQRQGFGRVIALSSVAGVRVRHTNLVYGASKAGMDGFFLNLPNVLDQVQVTVVRPGQVKTKMVKDAAKAQLQTTPKKVAKQVLRAVDSGRQIVWCPAIFRPIMALYRHLPRKFADRLKF